MSFNKGYASGFEKLHPRRKRLVYVPLYDPLARGRIAAGSFHAYGQCITDGTTKTADVVATLTARLDQLPGFPTDGSIRAVRVQVIAQNSTVNDHYVHLEDFDSLAYGGETHFGKVAGLYSTQTFDRIYTNGFGQFYWGLAWTAGTSTIYIRALGYYRDASD